MPISEATYERVALEDPEGQWELVCGRLRSKPPMTAGHNEAARRLAVWLGRSLDEDEYSVATDNARLRISTGTYYVPDCCVIPRELVQRKMRELPSRLEVYDEPMPLVVEVWSPSTGDYDVEEKLREYQRRGDLEIWRIHPSERTLTAWRRSASGGDGGYEATVYRTGSVQPATMLGVSIELVRLFG